MTFMLSTNDDILEELSARLRAQRLAQGLAQQELALMAGLSHGQPRSKDGFQVKPIALNSGDLATALANPLALGFSFDDPNPVCDQAHDGRGQDSQYLAVVSRPRIRRRCDEPAVNRRSADTSVFTRYRAENSATGNVGNQRAYLSIDSRACNIIVCHRGQ